MIRRCLHVRSVLGFFLLLASVTILRIFLLYKNVGTPPDFILEHPYFFYDSYTENLRSSDQKCVFPRSHPFPPSIWNYLFPPKPIVCKSRTADLTFIDRQARLRFNDTALDINGYVVGESLKCNWAPVVRAGVNEEDDLHVAYGKEAVLPREGVLLPPNVEVVRVQCRKFPFFSVYEKIHAHIRNTSLNASTAQHLKHPVNVLIFGLDSLSRMAFIRLLPRTYRYLTEDLNVTVFRGMNKVGDNTYPNLIALLTGQKAYGGGLPDYSQGFDNFPLLWKNFSSAGYATMWAEDFPDFGLFTYLAKGFLKIPTLHYLRPFWLAIKESSLLKLSSHLCYGSTPMHWLQTEYTDRFVSRYEAEKIPYFGFSFLAEISHEYISPVSSADEYFMNFFKSLQDRGYLDKTLLIVMSDHGHRFDPIRKTEVGYIEERMPFYSMHIPKIISSHQPSAEATLRQNSGRLITPFDVHATLLDLLNFANSGEELGTHISNGTLGRTLFSAIPAGRMCSDVSINIHYCTCESETVMDVSDAKSQTAGRAIIDHLNLMLQTSGAYNLCAELSLRSVNMAHLVLNAEDSADGDSQKVRVIIEAEPSSALFEATVRLRNGKTEVLGDVSRINPYGDQSSCIRDVILRKYCFCSKYSSSEPKSNKI